ncbi:ATP-binding protein [Neolewinella sp.]|uniref:ATP-binding protein n=1 Tax=Neolewinella sp. TaxID=2993543 RepID=UPI003B51758B
MLAPVRLLFMLILCALLPPEGSAQNTSLAGARLLAGSCLVDTTGGLSIDEVRGRRDWLTPGERDYARLTDYYVWAKIELDNPTDHSVAELLLLNRNVDSAWVYTQRTGAKIEYLGLRTASGDRAHYASLLPATYPVSLRPHDSMTVYARLHFRDPWPLVTIAAATRHEMGAVMNAQLSSTAWHFFYAGIMLSISLLSLFVFVMFRDRSLVLFAWVTLSFGAYFLVVNVMTDVLGLPSPIRVGIGSLQLVITSLVVSMSAFIARFIRLPCTYPNYNRLYWLVVLLTVTAQFVPYLLGWHVLTILRLANALLLVWILTVLAPILVMSHRGYPAARQLLVSSLMLALPGLAYLSQLMLTSAQSSWLQYGLQFGSLSFTAVLVRALARQIRDMRSTTERLTEQTELKSRFFANISHEFRTPLTLIMSPLEQLLERHPPDQGADNDHALLTLAHTNAKRQLELVNRILQLSRLEADATGLDHAVVDAVSLVQSTVADFIHLAEQREVSLRCVATPQQILARLDAQKIEDVLLNLITNAIKFTPAGGAVTVRVGERGSDVQIAVCDTGVGISQAQLSTIFERFFRAPDAERGQVEGTGLGLSLVRELVRLHGGTVRVASQVGEGTTFTVELPNAVVTDEAWEAQHDSVVDGMNSSAALPATEKIAAQEEEEDWPLLLLVEDSAPLRELLQLTLQHGYRITEAEDGRAGLLAAKQLHPDLIISDVAMPGMDGYELVEAIKQDVEVSHIPVILLTARAGSEDRISGLRVGADAYLTKPVNHRELLARVTNLLESRKLLRQRYATSIALKPAEVTTTPADSDFLQRCMDVVEAHLSEEKFRVADLAGAVSMSPASLNRKLRSLLDQSTNQFIQSVRLQRAHDLLTTSAAVTVAEVGHATGFSSTTYFVRVYREKYGETPGSVLKGI